MRAIVVLISIGFLGACARQDHPLSSQSSIALSQILTTADVAGFDQALEARPFDFPSDHNSHPQFKTEWWYFTGNLSDARGNAFGYQLTFFRFALGTADGPDGSAWRSREAWMGHFSITDVTGREFVNAERFSRDGLALAGNAAEPFRLWIEDWSAVGIGEEPFPLRLRAGTTEDAFDLHLQATRSPIAHGEQGLDRKGPEAGNASYYYSVPRLATAGELTVGGERYSVSGSSWMDREWSSNALSPGLDGWDWLALELSDGHDLVVYHLRASNGESSPFSSGSVSAADREGETALGRDDFIFEARDYWTSPASGARYPVGWSLRVPSANLDLEVRPLIPNQEMNLSVRYWEGAVAATGTRDGDPITGRGYLELTGY